MTGHRSQQYIAPELVPTSRPSRASLRPFMPVLGATRHYRPPCCVVDSRTIAEPRCLVLKTDSESGCSRSAMLD